MADYDIPATITDRNEGTVAIYAIDVISWRRKTSSKRLCR